NDTDQSYTKFVYTLSGNKFVKVADGQTQPISWKTYSGIDFSFKYPATWYLDISSPSFLTMTNFDSSKVPGSDAPISKENIVISIYKYANLSSNETVESWVNKIGLSGAQNILVDGIKAIRGKIIYTG